MKPKGNGQNNSQPNNQATTLAVPLQHYSSPPAMGATSASLTAQGYFATTNDFSGSNPELNWEDGAGYLSNMGCDYLDYGFGFSSSFQPRPAENNTWPTGGCDADFDHASASNSQSLIRLGLNSGPSCVSWGTAFNQDHNLPPSFLFRSHEVAQPGPNLPLMFGNGEENSLGGKLALTRSTTNKNPLALIGYDPEAELHPTGLYHKALIYTSDELRKNLEEANTKLNKAKGDDDTVGASKYTIRETRDRIRLLESVRDLRQAINERNKVIQPFIECASMWGVYLSPRHFPSQRWTIINPDSNEKTSHQRVTDKEKVVALYVEKKSGDIAENKCDLGVFFRGMVAIKKALEATSYSETCRKNVVNSLFHLSALGYKEEFKAACDSLLKSLPNKQPGNQGEIANSDEDYEQSYEEFRELYLQGSMGEELYTEVESELEAKPPSWKRVPGRNPNLKSHSHLVLDRNEDFHPDACPYLTVLPWNPPRQLVKWLPEERPTDVEEQLEKLLRYKEGIEKKHANVEAVYQRTNENAELYADVVILSRLHDESGSLQKCLVEFLKKNGIEYSVPQYFEEHCYSVRHKEVPGGGKPTGVMNSESRRKAACEFTEEMLWKYRVHIERRLWTLQTIHSLLSISKYKTCTLEDLQEDMLSLVSATQTSFESVQRDIINRMILRRNKFGDQDEGVSCLQDEELLEQDFEKKLKYYSASKLRQYEYVDLEVEDYRSKKTKPEQTQKPDLQRRAKLYRKKTKPEQTQKPGLQQPYFWERGKGGVKNDRRYLIKTPNYGLAHYLVCVFEWRCPEMLKNWLPENLTDNGVVKRQLEQLSNCELQIVWLTGVSDKKSRARTHVNLLRLVQLYKKYSVLYGVLSMLLKNKNIGHCTSVVPANTYTVNCGGGGGLEKWAVARAEEMAANEFTECQLGELQLATRSCATVIQTVVDVYTEIQKKDCRHPETLKSMLGMLVSAPKDKFDNIKKQVMDEVNQLPDNELSPETYYRDEDCERLRELDIEKELEYFNDTRRQNDYVASLLAEHKEVAAQPVAQEPSTSAFPPLLGRRSNSDVGFFPSPPQTKIRRVDAEVAGDSACNLSEYSILGSEQIIESCFSENYMRDFYTP